MVQIVKVIIIVSTLVPAFAAPINLEHTTLDAREPEPVNPATLIKAGKLGWKLLSGASLATSFAPLFHHHHHKTQNQPREMAEEVELEIREPFIFPTMAELKAFGKFLGMAGKKAKGGVEFGATVAPFIPRFRKSKQNQPNHRRSLEEFARREPAPAGSLRLPHMKLPHLRWPHLRLPHVKFPHISHSSLAKAGGGIAAVAGFGGIIAASQFQNRDLEDVKYGTARELEDTDFYQREYNEEEIYPREDEEDNHSCDYADACVAHEWEMYLDLRGNAGSDELD